MSPYRKTPIDPSLIREEFPVNRNAIFLNHAGIACIPTRTVKAMNAFNEDVRDHASQNSSRWFKKVNQVRSMVADFLVTDPENVAFVSRTSEGINFVAQGLDWKSGDNVVLPAKEYPANVYPWMNLANRGVEVRFVPEREFRFDPEEILARMDDRTRVLSISHVEFSNGFRHPVEALGKTCRERGVLFCLDAIQAMGIFDIDVEAMGVDALFCGGHKWLLGPTGTGFFFTTPALRERLHPAFVGANSVINWPDYLDYRLEFRAEAGRYEYGMLNLAGILGLGASLSLFTEIGLKHIRSRVQELTDHLVSRLEKGQWSVRSPRDGTSWSGIVVADPPDRNPADVVRYLSENGVTTSLRDGGVRFAPHFHNSEEQLDRVMALLD